ncbi:MAG: UbiH/UbiF family hydroxylase [Betaproteobacteria bacterium]|nr:UbiH/UbiF family hydroxylase [Betaproteobacteria bacterium]
MTQSADVVIVGAGLVGASLALALRASGLSVALIEPRAPAMPGDAWDGRVYAVSPGSAAFLAAVGAWQNLDAERVARVESMRIFGDAQSAQLDFNAYDAGLSELAFIAENNRLQAVLWQHLQRAAHVRVLCPAQCTAMRLDPERAEIELADCNTLRARLIVGADGAQSWVREQAGINVVAHDYAQSGVVANFTCALAHHDTAFQWFRTDGVLALLPLPGRRVSMVWSTPETHAQALLALDAQALAQRVAEASGGAVGALEVITPPAAFPLKLQRVAQFVTPRLALVGDAAHNVHPLAGQGVNLGFRDARELARVLCERGAQHDVGDYALLRRYERARKEDVLSMQWATDGLHKLFASPAVWLSQGRNLGLRAANSQPLLKKLLVKHAIT